MTPTPCRLSFFALAFASVACSGSSSGTTPASGAQDPAAALDTAVDALAGDLCPVFAQCSPPFVKIYVGDDLELCKKEEATTLRAGLHQPGVLATAADIDACRTALLAGGCDVIFKYVQGNDLPAPCRAPGSLADGAGCAYHLQCQSAHCDRPTPAACGTCAARRAAGAACTDDAQCENGLVCGNDGACIKPGGRGEACDDKHPCFGWLGCHDGTCGDPLAEGQPCKNLTSDCDLYGKGLVCVANACTALSFVAPGEDCGIIGGKAAACSGGACAPSMLKGTCVGYADVGQACDTVLGPTCGLHGDCIDKTCVSLFAQTCK